MIQSKKWLNGKLKRYPQYGLARDLGCLASKYSAVAAVSVWSMSRCSLGSIGTPPASQVPKITLDYVCPNTAHARIERDILKTKTIHTKDLKN